MFILLLFCYWLLVSASKGYHEVNIYKKLKMLVHAPINFNLRFSVNIGLLMAF